MWQICHTMVVRTSKGEATMKTGTLTIIAVLALVGVAFILYKMNQLGLIGTQQATA
jgi:hypothetical protein